MYLMYRLRSRDLEDKFDDDTESIITNERYQYISEVIKGCYKKKNKEKLTLSDKIDRVVTNRFLALTDLCSSYVAGVLYIRNNSWRHGY